MLPRRLQSLVAFLGREQPVRLFCQDESRIGLHLPCYRRLTAFGTKPHQLVEPLYEYYWLYGAVEPKTGEAFYLEMPRLDSVCFGIYLRELGKHYRESLCIVVLDNAPAHVASTVEVPENVVLLPLPAYSPELNPVERLWQDIKRRIDVFDVAVRTSLAGLREHVAEIVRSYTASEIASLTGYDYLLDAVNAL